MNDFTVSDTVNPFDFKSKIFQNYFTEFSISSFEIHKFTKQSRNARGLQIYDIETNIDNNLQDIW